MRTLLVVGTTALALSGCAAQDGSQAPPPVRQAALSDIAAETTEKPLEPRAQTYKDTLSAAGVPDTGSNATILVLAQGICDQLAEGTPEPEILGKLQPLAAYTATLSAGRLTGDEIAALYLAKAKATFC